MINFESFTKDFERFFETLDADHLDYALEVYDLYQCYQAYRQTEHLKRIDKNFSSLILSGILKKNELSNDKNK